MNRAEFMEELEYLLSDIPDGEKSDAIEYYRDYLEEAGTENEEQVIREFGSPERIASIIRSEISGNMKDGGEFTENGYMDERFKDPNYQMAKRYDYPETVDDHTEDTQGSYETDKRKKENSRAVKITLWIILLIAASPILLGLGSSLAGIVTGILGCLLVLVILVGAMTAVFLVLGFIMALAGIVSMAIHPISGILLFGLGILFLGLGLFALAVSGAFYGKFLPFLFRSMVNIISRFIYGRRKRS